MRQIYAFLCMSAIGRDAYLWVSGSVEATDEYLTGAGGFS